VPTFRSPPLYKFVKVSYRSVVPKMTNGVADHAGDVLVNGTEAGASHQETSGGVGVAAGQETTSQSHLHESALLLLILARAIILFSDIPTPLRNSDLTVALMGTVAPDSRRLFRSFRGDLVSVAKSLAERRLQFRKHVADSGKFAFFIPQSTVYFC
jgi:hypothetical protein